MQLFYCENIESEQKLDVEEARHCFNVLRKKEGDLIDIIDGKGFFYQCEVLNTNPKKNLLKIISKREEEKRNRKIHLVVSPTKNMDRNEWMVEKAVEIGVSEISFVLTSNSERRQLKLDRLVKKTVSAMKQSLRATLPKLNKLVALSDFLSVDDEGEKFIAHITSETKKLDKSLLENLGKDIVIMIGAEGGFSDEEVQLSVSKGFKPISLGENRLRTETAAIFSLSLLNQ